jgi:hypothetical protein
MLGECKDEGVVRRTVFASYCSGETILPPRVSNRRRRLFDCKPESEFSSVYTMTGSGDSHFLDNFF